MWADTKIKLHNALYGQISVDNYVQQRNCVLLSDMIFRKTNQKGKLIAINRSRDRVAMAEAF